MGHILTLASASAAITATLSLLAGFDRVPAAPAAPPPQALALAATDVAPSRAIRVIPIAGHYGSVDRPVRR